MSAAPRLRPALRALRLPAPPRAFSHSARAPARFTLRGRVGEIPYLPRILQPTTWVPAWSKHRRLPDGTLLPAAPRDWNPATFFIWIFLLIGSQAIQFIRLRHEHADFKRRADIKLDLLRSIVKRVQAGEEVDVAKELGTGREGEEREWEEVLAEIERGNLEFEQKKSEEKRRRAKAREELEESLVEGLRRRGKEGERKVVKKAEEVEEKAEEKVKNKNNLSEKDYML